MGRVRERKRKGQNDILVFLISNDTAFFKKQV